MVGYTLAGPLERLGCAGTIAGTAASDDILVFVVVVVVSSV